MNYIQGISEEKDFEVSAVEIVEYNLVIVCVYRSPDGDFAIFLQKLETVIKKIIVRKKQIILCGDWNINFMQESKKLRDLQEILLLYNLVNTVTSPTRVSKNSTSLIDVIITNKEITRDTATVIDLGYSDHMAQVLKLPIKKCYTDGVL
jgi:exonuclease III